MKSLKCACLNENIEIIKVESKVLKALPGIDIVGLAGAVIKESVLRAKSALNSLNFALPPSKIIINLSPSDVKKNGSHFDLAIAMLILLQKHKFDNDFFVFGELGLDGKVKETSELFSIILFLSSKVKNAKLVVPKSIAKKVAMIPNYEVFGVENIGECLDFFTQEEAKEQFRTSATHQIFQNALEICGQIYVPNPNFALDFKDIKGQERAKRACLIAAAGMHNVIFEGSPGCGKSMSAKRLVYILPPQSLDEILLASAYKSLNSDDSDFMAIRAFRSPHHSSTRSSIFGGGTSQARIGEVALANGGVLFFDELPHFSKQVLESLREPLEDNQILISRVNSKVTYQTKFLFAAALNPCPCGNLFNKNSTCTCSCNEIKRYKDRISGPLLDRIDLYVAMDEVSKNDESTIDSKTMQELVLKAFKAQKTRGQSELNGKLNDNETMKFCTLNGDAKLVLDKAISSYNLSLRGINKVLKVARTIADLQDSQNIEKSHILEALSYRIRENR